MAKKGLLTGYMKTLKCNLSRERYMEKLSYVNNIDPYELPKDKWIDDVELWPSITYIHVGMYLLFSRSPYTQEQLLNYKSLDCYQKFVNGWVRDVLVKKFGGNCLMIAKVSPNK